MRKWNFLTGLIVTGFALGLPGCEGETKTVEPKIELPKSQPGPAYDPGPVQPSPTPAMPPTGPSTATETKKDEAKSDSKKDEPKLEMPK
jgi:hypothetical protein